MEMILRIVLPQVQRTKIYDSVLRLIKYVGII